MIKKSYVLTGTLPFFVIFCSFALISGCMATERVSPAFSEEESEWIAKETIQKSEVYTEHAASTPILMKKDDMGCRSCYSFLYEFDTEDSISVRMRIEVKEGLADTISVTRISGFMVEEQSGEVCENHKDCETPMDYLLRSSCPYESRCIRGTCVIVCPIIE